MKQRRCTPLLLIASFACVPLAPRGMAATGDKPTVPPIPLVVNESERALLGETARLVGQKQFDQAKALILPLTAPSRARVYVDWAAVPEAQRAEYRQAAEQAIRVWNEGLQKSLRFETTDREADADLRIQFQASVVQAQHGQTRLVCDDAVLDLPSRADARSDAKAQGATAQNRRVARVRIAVNGPYSETPHSAASVTHLVGKGLGVYLGLAPSTRTGGDEIMGPEKHDASEVVAPSAQELERARQLHLARVRLAEYAKKRVPAHFPEAVLNVAKTDVEAGDVRIGDSAHFVFGIKNPGDAPLEIIVEPACGCTVAHYDKVIPPGGEGKIEAEVKTAGFRGRMAKTIVVKSNDLDKPKIGLQVIANVLPDIEILPGNAASFALKEGAPSVKEFQLKTRVSGDGGAPIEISRVTTSVPYAVAELVPAAAGAAGPGRDYVLKLTVQPEAPTGRTAFVVTAFTTSPREPQVSITAVCEKGILPVPQSVFMGTITGGTAMPVTQIVTLTKSDGAFRVEKVESDDPNLKVEQEAVREGAEYRLTLRYGGGWSPGTVRSKITVNTSDPRQPRIEIPVVASVVAAATSASK